MNCFFKYFCYSCYMGKPTQDTTDIKYIIKDLQSALNNESIHVVNALINKAILHLSENPHSESHIIALNRCIIARNKREPFRGIILHLSSPPSNIKSFPKALVFRVKCEDCKKVNKVCGGIHNNIFAPAVCPNCQGCDLMLCAS